MLFRSFYQIMRLTIESFLFLVQNKAIVYCGVLFVGSPDCSIGKCVFYLLAALMWLDDENEECHHSKL